MKPIILPKRNYNKYKLEIENSQFYKTSDLFIDDLLEIEYEILDTKIKREVSIKVLECETNLTSEFEFEGHQVTVFIKRGAPSSIQVFLGRNNIFFTRFDLPSEKGKLIEFMKNYFIKLKDFIPQMDKNMRSFYGEEFTTSIKLLDFDDVVNNEIIKFETDSPIFNKTFKV
jgi:hypothetical protein